MLTTHHQQDYRGNCEWKRYDNRWNSSEFHWLCNWIIDCWPSFHASDNISHFFGWRGLQVNFSADKTHFVLDHSQTSSMFRLWRHNWCFSYGCSHSTKPCPQSQQCRVLLFFIKQVAKAEKLFRLPLTVQREIEWNQLRLYFQTATSPLWRLRVQFSKLVETIAKFIWIRQKFKIDFGPEELLTVLHYMFLAHLKALSNDSPTLAVVKGLSQKYANEGTNNILGPSGYAITPFHFSITQTLPATPNQIFT